MTEDSRQLRFDDGKDAGALRTIGELSHALDIRQHVLRYWEQQFPMLRPLKRSGGRRYYRPEDIALVETINRLINREGYTLKGARQAIEKGVRSVSGAADSSPPPSPAPSKEEPVRMARDAEALMVGQLRGIRDRLARALSA